MEYKEYKCHSYNIYTMNTDKFKTCKIEIVFRNNVDKMTICKRTLLTEILFESCKKYNQKRLINLEFEKLYNSFGEAISTRVGNTLLTTFSFSFINPKYCEKNTISELIDLIKEIILFPNVDNGRFNEREFNICKSIIKENIESLKEKPKSYAFYKALLNMDSNSNSSINVDGTLEDLEVITPKNLYEEYLNMLEHDYCDIFIVGNLDMNDITKKVKNLFKLNVIKKHNLNMYVNNSIRKKPQTIIEEEDYSQGQLVMIYNLDNLTDREKDSVIRVYNYILGEGSLESKLYQNIREKKSLCYNTGSYYQKYDELLIINAGIDKNSYNEAVKEVKSCVKDMENGAITEEEFINAKIALIERLKLSVDSKRGILSNLQFKIFDNLKDYEERIEDIKSVEINELIDLSKKIKLNTIYFLKGDK